MPATATPPPLSVTTWGPDAPPAPLVWESAGTWESLRGAADVAVEALALALPLLLGPVEPWLIAELGLGSRGPCPCPFDFLSFAFEPFFRPFDGDFILLEPPWLCPRLPPPPDRPCAAASARELASSSSISAICSAM